MKPAQSKALRRDPWPFLRSKTSPLTRLRRRLAALLLRRSRLPRRRVIHLARTEGLVLHEHGA